ncbi:MAG: peptidyl-prolyl cis-trans isomerase [Gammaproteobacteria bacterium]|nr:peptidyl-prolyl cis-trans isomerase [Gammaproteobacteria bacterium]
MTNRPALAAWLREPLLHFLLIGAALFALYHYLNPGNAGAPREIVVSESQVEALAENFAKTWMRPPTAQELKGLIDDYVAEEVYYREAIAMGLDRDDIVIRRRLRQKMEFISEDVTAAAQPTDAVLQAYLEQHAEKFLQPPRLTFQQVFFSTDRRGDGAMRDAEKLLAQLDAGRGPPNPIEAGDPTLLPPAMESATPQEIVNSFGSDFADAVERAPVGQWSGPVRSGFGVHLVRVDRRDAGAMPTLTEIRPIVQREWESDQRREVTAELLAKLRSKYDVRVEGPAAGLYGSAAAGRAGGGVP